jgi:hypothetical protein
MMDATFAEECKQRQLRAWLDGIPIIEGAERKPPPIAPHIVTMERLQAVGCNWAEACRAMDFALDPWNEGLTLSDKDRARRVNEFIAKGGA